MMERAVLSRANHPHVVKILASFQSDRHLFIALELCPGGDLGVVSRWGFAVARLCPRPHYAVLAAQAI